MSELRECPFCGGDNTDTADRNPWHHGYRCYCATCSVYGPSAPSPQEAAHAWNTRPREAKLEGALREASGALNDCGRRLAELGDKSAAHIAREHGEDARALLKDTP